MPHSLARSVILMCSHAGYDHCSSLWDDAVFGMLISLALSHQVVQSAKALQWIMDSLKSRGFAAQEAQPSRQKLSFCFILTVNLLHISSSFASSHCPLNSVDNDRQAHLRQFRGKRGQISRQRPPALLPRQ